MSAPVVAEQRAPFSEQGETKKQHIPRSVLTGVSLLGFALPAAAYLWFIHQYGSNVPIADQWVNFNLIGHSYSGTLSLGDLWAQHVAERMFFPNLVVLLLGHTAHFNLFVEMYLSAILLFIATGLLIVAHKRRSPSTSWIYYWPVAIMMWSFVQFDDTLWGFQVAWYLIVLALVAVLFLLDKPTLNSLILSGAIAAAIVGSYSSIQGLLIWPAGLVLLYQRRRSQPLLLAWILSAVAAGVGYVYRLQPPSHRLYVLHHPVTAAKLFFLAIGDIIAQPTPPGGDNAILLLGVLIFLIGTWVVIRYGLRRDETSGAPIGVALICFGFLFALAVPVGTVWVSGAWVGTGSRYAIYLLLVLVGSYLALISRPVSKAMDGRRDAIARILVRTAVVAVICLQVVLGAVNGLAGGRTTHQARSAAADVLVNIDHASNAEIWNAFAWDPPPGSITVMRSLHLTLFGTNATALYAKEGLVLAPESLAFASTGEHRAKASTGQAFAYVVQAAGSPFPTISSRDLPPWLLLTDQHNGMATLSAINPHRGIARFTLTAENLAGRINQVFRLIIKHR